MNQQHREFSPSTRKTRITLSFSRCAPAQTALPENSVSLAEVSIQLKNSVIRPRASARVEGPCVYFAVEDTSVIRTGLTNLGSISSQSGSRDANPRHSFPIS